MNQLGHKRMLVRPWLSRKGSSLRWLVPVLLQCTLIILVSVDMTEAACAPQSGCETAYAFYKAQADETLDSIGAKFQITSEEILAVNSNITLDQNQSTIVINQPLYIPFKCECIQNKLLHMFKYRVQREDTIEFIASTVFEDLTETNWIGTWNALPDVNFILSGDTFKIPVKCFCGDPNVSLDYSLFLTYVVAAGSGGNLSGLASTFNTSEALLREYNPSVNWNGSKVDQHVFIPVKDKSGNYPSYSPGSSEWCDAGDEITIAGVLVGVATGVGGALVFLSLLAVCRHCVDVEQRRRQQRKQLANKLKNMAEYPISQRGYNEVKK